MIKRLQSENNPSFFFLAYDKVSLKIENFLAIPKYFFVPNAIEQRKALGLGARRAGWVGCNIRMEGIPALGKIYYVKDKIVRSKAEVLHQWNETSLVRALRGVESKGWLLDVLFCLEKLQKNEFSLHDVYGFTDILSEKHPANRNVRAKIRQQLQYMRDKGFIEFTRRGQYRIKGLS